MLTGIFARLFGCLCVLGVGVMASHAEPNSDALLCRDIELSRGIIAHGGKLCNSPTVAGASWLVLSVGSNQCANKGIHDNNNSLGLGFKIFDGSAKTIGLNAACERIDIFLQETDKLASYVSRYPPHYDNDVLFSISNVVLAMREGAADQEPLSGEPAANHADEAAKCDPLAITADALFVHATIACNKNYMDSAIGIDVHNRALACRGPLTMKQQESIIKKAFLMFEADAKKFGKTKACRKVDDIWKAGTITPAQCDSSHC